MFREIRSTDGQWVADSNGSGCVGGNVINDARWSNIQQFTSINGGKKQVQDTNAPFRDVDVSAIKIRILACDATPKPYNEMMQECVAWAETVVKCPEPNTDEYCHADLVPATGSDVYSNTGFCLWNINAFDGCQNPYKCCVTQNNFYKWSCR